MSLSRLALWRNAVRDSDVGPAAKALGWCLSTYMSGAGVAWPSQHRLAEGCSVSVRTIQRATDELEQAGLIELERSLGRTSHVYAAAIPSVLKNAPQRRHGVAVDADPNGDNCDANGDKCAPNGDTVSPESAESAESAALAAAAALDVPPPRRPENHDDPDRPPLEGKYLELLLHGPKLPGELDEAAFAEFLLRDPEDDR